MIEVTDMILKRGELLSPNDIPSVDLHEATGSEVNTVLELVRSEHPRFSRYFESPKPKTVVCGIWQNDELIGAVLLEGAPESAERETDGALACLVIRSVLRKSGLGSSAIVASCRALFDRGFERVIADWVASIPLYRRLGFDVWRTRLVDPDNG